MIYVSQGHEKSIGLEVFFKSLSLLSSSDCNLFTLVANKEEVINSLELCSLNYKFQEDNLQIGTKKILFKNIEKNSKPLSTLSLEYILKKTFSDRDILLTLPTSKDQLLLNSKNKAGYTEYLREWFNKPSTSMLFSSINDNVLLVTDHIPLKEVPSIVSKDLIYEKVQNVLDNYPKYFEEFEEVIFAGINPHAGENGILGSEDVVIEEAMDLLRKKYNIPIKGPFSGDTLHFHKTNKKQLFIYMFHDQGLPIFKAQNQTIGLNISLGLPILRMSVDHGTAFDIYGKNCADYMGCYYLLRKSIEAHRKI